MKKRNHKIFALASLAGMLAAAACAIECPQINVPLTDTPPRIDGLLDDACWEKAYVSPAFYQFQFKQTDYQPNADTTVRMLTDGRWLFVACECRHPDPGAMKAEINENFGGNVFGDECIKIFLNPGLPEDNQFYRYVLNYKNVHQLTRSFTDAAGKPLLSWPSATQITPTGWNAEVAIPLFELVGFGDLNPVWLNVFRKQLVRQYDHLAVEIGVEASISTLSPTSEWARRAEMARLTGLAEALRPDFPFVANMGDVTVGTLSGESGALSYDVGMTLKAMTGAAGTAEVVVVETSADGAQRQVAKSFALQPRQVLPVAVTVPVTSPGQRDLDVIVRDASDGMPFQTWQVRNAGGFELLHAMARLNYYTAEDAAEVLYRIGMSAAMLADKSLIVRDAAGREQARLASPAPNGLLAFPLRDISNGCHTFSLELADQAGQCMFSVEFELTKLPPKPGQEWKIDRARGGTLLHDGEPFFPLGFCMDVDEEQYREVAAAGFNTVLWWSDIGLKGWSRPMEPADFVKTAELARKYGLMLMARPEKIAKRQAEMTTLKKYFPGEKYNKALAQLARGFINWKFLAISGAAPWNELTRPQRNEIAADWMDLHLPLMLDNVRAVCDLPNVLAYNTLDEPPEFREADLDVQLLRMTKAIKEIDPYRPMSVIYSSKIPVGAKYTDFADALGTDPYWTPGRAPLRGSINWVSAVTARTVSRARERGMMPWTIPMASLWSDTHKRIISGAEQICQTYLALIHGTRGIIYFTHDWVATVEQWEALQTLAARIKVMTPALVGLDPEQAITYTPGVWAPLRDELPDVQCRLMRFPDGRYVLLAANVRISPVALDIKVDGLQDDRLRDLFDGELGAINAGAFTDTLPGRGVRSYVFDKIDADGVVRIETQIKTLGDAGTIEPSYSNEGRVGMKNILPNPSFEDETIPGWPDYYKPQGRYVGWRQRIGSPDAPVGLTTNQPYHGEKCLFLARAFGNILWSFGPQLPVAKPYVFSFYARTDSPEPVSLLFKSGLFEKKSQQYIKISGREWTRYSLRLIMPAGYAHPSNITMWLIAGDAYFQTPSAPVFLDAFQLEPGLEPTEFEP